MPKALEGGAAGRRSTRVPIAIPVMLSGQDTSGKNFQESTRTLVINKQGAKVLTKYKLALGAELAVENRALGHITKANVVWLGKPPGPNEPAELGIQLIKAENFWGIDFPPEDWEEISAKGGTGAKPQAKAPEKEASPPPPAPPPVGIGAKPAEPEKPSPGAGSTPGISGPGTLIGVKLPSIPTQPSEPAAPPPPPAPQPTPEPNIDISDVDRVFEGSTAKLKERYEGVLLSVLKDFEKRMVDSVRRIDSDVQSRAEQALTGFRQKIEQVEGERLGDVEERLTKGKKDLEHVLDSAQTASEIVEDERERAGEVVGEIEELLETQAEKARRSTSAALDDVLAKVQSEVSETVRVSLMKSAKHSLEERLAKAREDLTENAFSMSEVARQRFAKEAEQVAQSLRDGLLQEIKGAQEQFSGTLEKVSGQWGGSLEAQRTAKANFDEHEKQVTQLSESALGKLREQAESVTSEATGQLRESLQSWQDENQKRIQGELQGKMDEILEGLAQRMNRHAEDTLEMISEELTQKSGKMIEASAETMRNRFAQLFSNVGLSMQQPGEAPQTSPKEDSSKEPSES
ncbi:MAG: hypothetical protein O7F56_02415 [Acidobacteria bacterium]|nr:hypothetical protein [Acidobacteriota bacterium]